MPKKGKPAELVETAEPWVPTRAPYLVDNPFASLTEEEARARLKDLYPQWRDLQYEIEQLERVVRSYSIVYFDQDGNVCRAK
jgi:hypothetical protein